MLVSRVKLPGKDLTKSYNDIIVYGNGKTLTEQKSVARPYKMVNGREVKFSSYTTKSNYRSEYTPIQNKLYKELINSKEANKLINRLKNTNLIRKSEITSILRQSGVNEKIVTKIRNLFYPKNQEHNNFDIEESEANNLSLKDLGITKQQIMTLFINEGLIPSYGKKQRKR